MDAKRFVSPRTPPPLVGGSVTPWAGLAIHRMTTQSWLTLTPPVCRFVGGVAGPHQRHGGKQVPNSLLYEAEARVAREAQTTKLLHELVKACGEAQRLTVVRLNNLTTGQWVVDAGALDTVAHRMCDLDADHGRGTCTWTLTRAEATPMLNEACTAGTCPQCAVYLLTAALVSGDHVAVDVSL